MSPVTRIIFFVETPFSQRDYDRYGIEILQKTGFDVEAWDFTNFLRPGAAQHAAEPDVVKWSGHKQFQNRHDACAAIAALTPSCFVVCIVAYQPASFSVYRALSRVPVRYCIVMTNVIPGGGAVEDSRSILDRIKQSSPRQLLNALFSRIPFRWWGIRPAALLLAGGTCSEQKVSAYPGDCTTRTLWAHKLDYDLYLNERDRSVPADAKMGVFLDEYMPFHPDYHRLGLISPSAHESYYPNLCRFFDFLEREYGIRIVIAAHPHSRYEDHPDYFGGRPVMKGKTLELVRKSGVVIAHSSTALNFAVLFHKPVLFITTDSLQRSQRMVYSIQKTATWLGKTPINVDAPLNLDWEKELALDPEAYMRYREAYIKKSGSPEKPVWQIFADFLKTVDV